jgi:hypothetical protein
MRTMLIILTARIPEQLILRSASNDGEGKAGGEEILART